MALYDTTRLAAASRGALHPGRALARLYAAFHAWRDRHATRKVLSRLSAHELADIGLDQGDLDAVANGRRRPS
jgi:uncharacterized protein YjiS (DUF1127 family)